MLIVWLSVLVLITAIFVVILLIAQARETLKVEEVFTTLQDLASRNSDEKIDFSTFSNLPPPVSRYFRHVLTDGQKMIKMVKIEQSGMLRTDTQKDTWSPFTANQLVIPSQRSFVWNSKVALPFSTYVSVLDSYIAGTGTGRVSLLSAFVVDTETDNPKLNSGALHRYLAEAVWFPTALLPQSGVVWSPIDDSSALATLTDRNTTVSLEFRFNEVGEVTGIYSTGRFGRFEKDYKKVPWEGHFRNYQKRQGMYIPLYGEVGWYTGEELQLVWKGELNDIHYEL